MSIKISNETKVGALTLAAIIALVFGYNYLRGKNLFRQQIVYYAVYERVDGLLPANPVLVNGLQIGIVDKIFLKEDDRSKVVVRFSLKIPIDIPKNSTLQIVSSSLLGDKALELKMPQTQTAEELGNLVYATPGDTLEGIREVGITEMALKEIQPIKEKAEHLIQTLDSTLVSINVLLNSERMDQIITDVSQSISSVRNSLKSIESTAVNVSKFSDTEFSKISSTLDNIEKLSKTIGDNTSKINTIVSNAERITDNLGDLSDNLAKTDITAIVQKANQTLAEIAEITNKIKNGEGSIAMLINNPDLYNNLEESSASLDRLLVDIKQNPKNYLGFSFITINKKDKTPAPAKSVPKIEKPSEN